MERARQIVAAARRLADQRGSDFTIQELAREAGIALQTFYKHFPSKDLAILAVIEDMITERCDQLREEARDIEDPVARLRFYVTAVLGINLPEVARVREPSFIATEHYRLLRLHPQELARATRAFTDLLLPDIHAAMAAGTLRPADPEYAAWLVTQLVIAVFHHYECAGIDEPADQIGERLWAFLMVGLGGSAPPEAAGDTERRGLRRRR
jgi:AcrR family transcriptional regulator